MGNVTISREEQVLEKLEASLGKIVFPTIKSGGLGRGKFLPKKSEHALLLYAGGDAIGRRSQHYFIAERIEDVRGDYRYSGLKITQDNIFVEDDLLVLEIENGQSFPSIISCDPVSKERIDHYWGNE